MKKFVLTVVALGITLSSWMADRAFAGWHHHKHWAYGPAYGEEWYEYHPRRFHHHETAALRYYHETGPLRYYRYETGPLRLYHETAELRLPLLGLGFYEDDD